MPSMQELQRVETTTHSFAITERHLLEIIRDEFIKRQQSKLFNEAKVEVTQPRTFTVPSDTNQATNPNSPALYVIATVTTVSDFVSSVHEEDDDG